MAEIKWIKLTTSMFDDEKIDYIESLPEADTILIIWIKLLTLAGKCNAGGYVFLTENIPYTEEMLSHKMRRQLNTVKLALATLENLHMIKRDINGICISNWDKHQNIEGMERIREQAKLRMQRFRDKQKALPCDVTVTQRYATDIELEQDKDIEIDKEDISTTPYREIAELYTQICTSLPKIRDLTDKRRKSIKALWKKLENIEAFNELFTKAESSDFLSGRSGTWNGCGFDWLMNTNNAVKVLEGNYDNKKQQPQQKKASFLTKLEMMANDGE